MQNPLPIAIAILLAPAVPCAGQEPTKGDRSGGFLLPPGLLDELATRRPTAGVTFDESLASHAYHAPQDALETAREHLNHALQAAFEAGRQRRGSGIATTGTLRPSTSRPGTHLQEDGGDPGLHVVSTDGTRTTYAWAEIQGNLRADPVAFLSEPHRLKVRIVCDEAIDLTLRSTLAPTTNPYRKAVEVVARGTLRRATTTWEVDLTARGSSFFEHDRTGHESLLQFRLTGTLRIDRTTFEVDEEWTVRSTSASDVGPRTTSSSRAGSVATVGSRTLRTRYRQDEHLFAFRDANVVTEFLNGRPNERSGNWRATGQLFRDEEPVARLRMREWSARARFEPQRAASRAWRLVLEHSSEEEIVLQSWPTR